VENYDYGSQSKSSDVLRTTVISKHG
jgi:hypothetical protein